MRPIRMITTGIAITSLSALAACIVVPIGGGEGGGGDHRDHEERGDRHDLRGQGGGGDAGDRLEREQSGLASEYRRLAELQQIRSAVYYPRTLGKSVSGVWS